MVILSYKLRVEAHHHSVKDIKKLTLFAEDVVEWASISKTAPAPHAVTQLLDSEDVIFIIIADGWSKKVQQRKGPGTGRMAYTKTIPRIFKNNIKGQNWLPLLLFKHFLLIFLYLFIF
jgi:hypothetical protein